MDMRLLYFVIQMDQLGGVARIVTDKVNWLVAHGYDVTVCDIENWAVTPYYELDPRVKFRVGYMQTTPGGVVKRLQGVWRCFGKVRQVLAEEQPDVVVNAHCPLVTWVLPLLRLCGAASPGADRTRRPCLITEMHQSRQGLEVFNRRFMSPLGRWLHRWSIRWIYGRYDKFVVLTHGDQRQWRLDNSVVIPNFSTLTAGVADDLRRCAASDARADHQIVMLARLMPQKRIDLMLEAWARVAGDFPDWHVKVLGDGMERQRLEQKARELGVADSFLMPGGVKDVRPELAASDVLCLTSEYEGFGIVLIEAMLMGVTVMAMEYVGVRDIVSDGDDGIVVPFGDVAAYAGKLRWLMQHPEERTRLAKAARASVGKFEKETVMRRWTALFTQITTS